MLKPKVNTKPVIPAEGLVRVFQLLECSPPIKPGPEVIAWPSKRVRAMLDGMKAVGQ